MIESIVALKAVIVGVWFALLFVAERVAPWSSTPRGPQRLVRNGGLWLLMTLATPFVVIPVTAYAAGHALWARPASLQGMPALLADFIVLDFWAYWAHRAYHEIGLLARFHRPHHLDERLDTTSAVRFHLGEVIISAFLRALPIVLFAMPFVHVVIFEIGLLMGAIFHHSNIRLAPSVERPLSWLIVTPSIHFIHHHAVRADTNSNYAGVFSVWDRLFGTSNTALRAPDMKIGLAGAADQPFMRLLISPFRRGGLR